ncbi:MAG: hypothetical protein PVG56_01880 [Anaerolineae bacterium]|jgi:hypothetical protein
MMFDVARQAWWVEPRSQAAGHCPDYDAAEGYRSSHGGVTRACDIVG